MLALNVEAALPPIRTKCYYQLQKSEHFACGECQYVAKAGHRSPRHNKPPRRYTKVSVWTQSKTAASKAEHRFKIAKVAEPCEHPTVGRYAQTAPLPPEALYAHPPNALWRKPSSCCKRLCTFTHRSRYSPFNSLRSRAEQGSSASPSICASSQKKTFIYSLTHAAKRRKNAD